MQHVAVMKKEWSLIEKIISGSKTIESRWYLSRRAPLGKIKKGDTIFFKNSGQPVTAKAQVSDVREFSKLNAKKVKKILNTYGGKNKLALNDLKKSYELYKDKKYCILVFLKNPTQVKPFNINKKGYGMMSSWICVENINDIKKGL